MSTRIKTLCLGGNLDLTLEFEEEAATAASFSAKGEDAVSILEDSPDVFRLDVSKFVGRVVIRCPTKKEDNKDNKRNEQLREEFKELLESKKREQESYRSVIDDCEGRIKNLQTQLDQLACKNTQLHERLLAKFAAGDDDAATPDDQQNFKGTDAADNVGGAAAGGDQSSPRSAEAATQTEVRDDDDENQHYDDGQVKALWTELAQLKQQVDEMRALRAELLETREMREDLEDLQELKQEFEEMRKIQTELLQQQRRAVSAVATARHVGNVKKRKHSPPSMVVTNNDTRGPVALPKCAYATCMKTACGGDQNFCTDHGGVTVCQFGECKKKPTKSSNYCYEHFQQVRCKHDGCDKPVLGSQPFCRWHGGNVCRYPYCNTPLTSVTRRQFCDLHGGEHCEAEDCSLMARPNSRHCSLHGRTMTRRKPPARKCDWQGCSQRTRNQAKYCVKHGETVGSPSALGKSDDGPAAAKTTASL